MTRLLSILINFIKKLIITVLLIPLAVIFVLLTYSGVIFGVIYYLWVKPEVAYELWNKLKSGFRDGTLIKDKLFYPLITIGLILIILGFIFGKL